VCSLPAVQTRPSPPFGEGRRKSLQVSESRRGSIERSKQKEEIDAMHEHRQQYPFAPDAIETHKRSRRKRRIVRTLLNAAGLVFIAATVAVVVVALHEWGALP
jgi:hypothetical protein